MSQNTGPMFMGTSISFGAKRSESKVDGHWIHLRCRLPMNKLTIAAKPCRNALGNYSVIGGAMGRTAAVDHTHFL
jgi:hypothetical protein